MELADVNEPPIRNELGGVVEWEWEWEFGGAFGGEFGESAFIVRSTGVIDDLVIETVGANAPAAGNRDHADVLVVNSGANCIVNVNVNGSADVEQVSLAVVMDSATYEGGQGVAGVQTSVRRRRRTHYSWRWFNRTARISRRVAHWVGVM